MPGCLQAVGTFRDGGGTSVTLRILTSSQAVVSTFLAAQRDAQLDALPPDCGLQRCYYHEVLAEETEMDGAGEEEDLSDDDLGEPYVGDITPAIRNAVRRVHEATGAPPAAVQAARELKCDVCDEHRRPKTRRAHIDLLLAEDATGRVFPVCHITDAVSKYQMAGVIPDRSSQAVMNFLARSWVPLLGPPARLIADQGREFISEAFQSWCSARSILLWITAVQAPWQNSAAVRWDPEGGRQDQVVIGAEQMADAVAEACAAYNTDANAEGVSPLQCVTGRQPRLHGSVLSNFGGRLAEHGLIDGEPTLASQACGVGSQPRTFVGVGASAWGHRLLLEAAAGYQEGRSSPVFVEPAASP
eukprot:s5837_g3.t1